MRDYVLEILEIRNRQGRSENLDLIQEIGKLNNAWQENESQRQILRNYIPIRIVTLLEVFSRNWTASLIDHGEPFLANAVGLSRNINVKFDLPIISAMQGKRITVGELIAHSLSYNNIDQINSNLSIIVNKKLKGLFAETCIRSLDDNSESCYSKITDNADADYAALEKLFNTRHVIVHEIPEVFPATDDEIEMFLGAANRFATALEIAFYTMLFGEMPLTQIEMNQTSGEQHKKATEDLEKIFDSLTVDFNSTGLRKSQAKWHQYMTAHCELLSGINEPFRGSMAPMIYSSCAAEMTKERIAKLKEYLEQVSEN